MQYDYYKVLEIPRTASLDDIKKAYRNKAKLLHPDVNDSPKANEVFQVVSQAYAVLTDDTKRYLHDVKLNHVDGERANAERKKHYYGSSVRNGSFTNSNFNYDWNSLSSYSYKEKTDEDYYKENPFLYNSFFLSGMLLGLFIVVVSLMGTFGSSWGWPLSFIAVAGFIIAREGWRGLMRKETMVGRLFKKFRR